MEETLYDPESLRYCTMYNLGYCTFSGRDKREGQDFFQRLRT